MFYEHILVLLLFSVNYDSYIILRTKATSTCAFYINITLPRIVDCSSSGSSGEEAAKLKLPAISVD